MALLNYTTAVPAQKSIMEIQVALAKAGASAVMSEFDDTGNIVALGFRLKLGDESISFRLPTDWHPVQELLIAAKARNPNMRPWQTTEDHARNVAWRITKDWVEAQLAIIETRMVTTAQVFLPYAVTQNGQSMYEYIASNNAQFLLKG